MVAKLRQKQESLEESQRSELADLAHAYKTLRAEESDNYQRDKVRYDSTVSMKEAGHTMLVLLSYLICFFISLGTNHYADRAKALIDPDAEAEEIAEFETRSDRIETMKTAVKAKYEIQGNQTEQLLHQVIAFLKQAQQGQAPNPISFKQNSNPGQGGNHGSNPTGLGVNPLKVPPGLSEMQKSVFAAIFAPKGQGDNPSASQGGKMGGNLPINPGQTGAGISHEDIAFLKKYEQVVRDTLDGANKPEAARNSAVSLSTVKNVRRVMKAVGLM